MFDVLGQKLIVTWNCKDKMFTILHKHGQYNQTCVIPVFLVQELT